MAVIQWCRIEGHRAGEEFRTRRCPDCDQRDREAVAINLKTGLWHCHAHGCGGDVLRLLGGYEGLNATWDYPSLIDLAVELIKSYGTRELCQLRRNSAPKWAPDRLQGAAVRAGSRWQVLRTTSELGEEYLFARNVLGAHTAGHVRFTTNGDPAVMLHEIDGDRVLNVVERRRSPMPDAAKVVGMPDCPTLGTFVGRVADITPTSSVFVVEGMFDALTATCIWPDAVVLGAHGAGNLPHVAEAAARKRPAHLYIVPHADDTGRQRCHEALELVTALGETAEVIDVGAKDLNESWCAQVAAYDRAHVDWFDAN